MGKWGSAITSKEEEESQTSAVNVAGSSLKRRNAGEKSPPKRQYGEYSFARILNGMEGHEDQAFFELK